MKKILRMLPTSFGDCLEVTFFTTITTLALLMVGYRLYEVGLCGVLEGLNEALQPEPLLYGGGFLGFLLFFAFVLWLIRKTV